MRVLHVLDHSLPIQSGYSFRTLKILQQQKKLGVETFQITGVKQGPSKGDSEESHGITFFRTPSKTHGISSWPFIKQLYGIRALRKRLEKCICEIKPDLLHVHSPVLNGLAALPLAKKYKIPMVYEIRAFWEDAAVDHGSHKENGIRYRLIRFLESYVVKKAQHVTTICEGLKTDLRLRGLSEQAMSVVPNAVDLESLRKHKVDNQLLEKLQIQLGLKSKYVLGYFGSFYAYEGLDLLLEACSKIKNEVPNLRILLAGEGPEEKHIQQKIHDLRLGKMVIMLGKKPHHEMPTLYALCHACVYPRRKLRLTDLVTPLKPLEAMAHGVLVLASDVGGHRELIEHQKTGLLFRANDVEDLAQLIFRCMHQSQPLEIIFTAKNYVLEQRTWAKITQYYKDVYDKALSA